MEIHVNIHFWVEIYKSLVLNQLARNLVDSSVVAWSKEVVEGVAGQGQQSDNN